MEDKIVSIRVASPEDAEKLLRIYAPYVENTAISFEYRVPELAEFRGRIEKTLTKYPYLVAEADGEAVGYAYLSALKDRPAYDRSAETTIYLRQDVRKKGVGRALYKVLESIAKAQNISNLYACIAYPEAEDEYLTKNSAQFHAHMGYAPSGVFRRCGCKFGRWYNIVWAEKIIGEYPAVPRPLVPFHALPTEMLADLGIVMKDEQPENEQ